MTINELIELLRTATSVEEIDDKQKEIKELIPQIERMIGFDQKNSYHQYDLWMHCLHTVIELPRNLDDDMLYLAALVHDIGKPDKQVRGTKPEDTNMHYYGHPERSADIVEQEIIPFFEKSGIILSADDKARLVYYVRYHDDNISLRIKSVRRHLRITTLDNFKKLMLLQIADSKAHVILPLIQNRIDICTKMLEGHADFLEQQILEGR